MNTIFPRPARCLAAALIVTLFAACAGDVPGTSRRPPTRGEYRIQPNDVLLITFAGEPDYNQQARVDWRGRIDLPALAAEGPTQIPAAGLTPAELAQKITDFGKANKILVAQRAQVFVTEYTGTSFVVLGQVNSPNRYFFQRGLAPQMDLEEAIALAGGYTRLARTSNVTIKRDGKVFRIDMRKLATDPTAGRFTVVPGDIITVPERIF